MVTMNITFSCPECHSAVRREIRPSTDVLDCDACAVRIAAPSGAVGDGTVHRCLVCPSRDLYVRKDIPQRLGVAVVAVGIIASSIAWAYYHVFWTFGILFATALVDFALFFVVGNCLMCYRCGAIYRDVKELEAHGPFNLETHEKYRQMAARLSQAPQSPRSS
jgi:hypothetical protein